MLIVFTYLITKDIVETLERKIGYQLNEELRIYIRGLENQFLKNFWQFVPNGIEKRAIDASSVSTRLDSIIRKNSYPIVSLDRVYLTKADEYLEVTRVTNPKTGEVTVSERPGNKSLSEQINDLKKYNQIILADVGAFEGETLLEICRLLEQKKISIEEIYLGFSSNEANRKINNSKKLTALNLFDFYEWIEMRDFFGIDGRNVGMDRGERLYIPYWENLPKWASIPREKEQEVIGLCRNFNRILLEQLKRRGYDTGKIGRMVKYEGSK